LRIIPNKIGSLIPFVDFLHNNISIYFNNLPIKLPVAHTRNFLNPTSGILLALSIVVIIESIGVNWANAFNPQGGKLKQYSPTRFPKKI